MNVDEHYSADSLSNRTTTLGVLAAALGGAAFAFVSWFILRLTHLPAFGGSYVSRGLSTAGSTLLLVAVGLLCFFWVRDQHLNLARPKWRTWLTYLVVYLAPAALVITVLAIPLSATKLYLDGVTIDQGFRTQYLTRLTTDWHLHDMNYKDLPAFYPAAWFWLGGRFGSLLGLSGWETYKPWALISMAAMCSILVPLWQRITASLPVAVAIALVNTAIFLVTSPEEPYAGVVAIGAPVAAMVMTRAFRGSKMAMAFVICYLGFSAATYTVVTGVIAFSIMLMAGILALFTEHSYRPVIRLVIIGTLSILIALISWGPYLWALLTGAPRGASTATHYLPHEGVQIPLPMFSMSLIGGLCLIGIIYLIVRFRHPDVRNLGITLIFGYFWIIASMVFALTGKTLLGFRIEILVMLVMATAGVLGLAEFRLLGLPRLLPVARTDEEGRRRNVQASAAMIVILTLAGVSYAQSIPQRLHTAIDLAYTDTDGNGERADRFPADSTQYFPEIDRYITSLGHERTDTIVLADSHSFLSFYPYWGFQARTSHYANPLGEFEARNAFLENLAIDSNKQLADPEKFRAALDAAPWEAPDVFIFTGSLDDPKSKWKYDLAEDIYPNNPNVRFRGVYFNPASFKGMNVKQIGPFVVVVR